jgi:hypothetical protein
MIAEDARGAPEIGELARGTLRDDRHDEIRRDEHARRGGGAGVERARDRRERDGDDGGVERREERRKRESGEAARGEGGVSLGARLVERAPPAQVPRLDARDDSGGDGPRLQQMQLAAADGPFEVLRRAEERLALFGEAMQ